MNYYSCEIESLSNGELIIPIKQEQFERYAANRIEIETKLVGEPIVGLNRDENVFMLGTVRERIDNGQQYRIDWCNGKTGKQSDEHLFAPRDANIRYEPNQYVLALDNEETIYRLGRVLSVSDDQTRLTVRLHRADRSQR